MKIKLFPSDMYKSIEKKEIKQYYSKQYVYGQMPVIIKNNFQNISEIFEQLSLTSTDKFSIETQSIVKIHLQIGTKVRYCLFTLIQSKVTYEEQIQILLWLTEKKLDDHQLPQHPYFQDVRQLQLLNQRHTRQIAFLNQRLMSEKQQKQKMQNTFEEQINHMRAQIYELKMYYEQFCTYLPKTKQARNEVKSIQSDSSVKVDHRFDRSSLICSENHVIPDIINIEEEDMNRLAEKAVQLKTVQKYFIDTYGFSDIDFSFKRVGQRLTFKKSDNKPRQFNSLAQLFHPIEIINFKLLRTKDHNIYVGVLLFDRVRTTSTRRDRGAISYKLKGELFEDGLRANINVEKINVGEVLTLLVDATNKHFQWYREGRLMFERQFPPQFTCKQLYPFINMVNEGDQLQFV